MSLWNSIWNFFSTFLNWDPDEAAKRKELKKIHKFLSSINPPFFNKNTMELLPGFAKTLLSFTRSIFPIYSLLEKTILHKDQKVAELYKNYLIEARLPEAYRHKHAEFAYKSVKERILDSVSGKDEIEKIKHEFHEYMKLLEEPEFETANAELNELYRFIAICHHHYEPLLSLFDQELIVNNTSYTPKFKPVHGNDIIPELIDIYYIVADFSMSVTIEKNLSVIIDRLKPPQAVQVKKQVNKLLGRIDKILKMYLTREILLSLLKAIKEDHEYGVDVSAESVNYIARYKSKISGEFQKMIDQAQRDISENNILQAQDELFKGREIVAVDGYTDEERDYLTDCGVNTFTYVKPFTILKNFMLLIFEVKIKKTVSKLILDGFYEDKAFQATFSNIFYSCVKIMEKIGQFEEGLVESSGGSLVAIHNELQKDERDADVTEKLNNIIAGINQRASGIIEEETNRFFQLLKLLSNILHDYKEKNPSYITNIKVINGNKNNEYMQELIAAYKKIELFISIMKNFTVIKQGIPEE